MKVILHECAVKEMCLVAHFQVIRITDVARNNEKDLFGRV